MNGLEYRIIDKPNYAIVECILGHGQTMIAEGGAMIYADGSVTTETRAKGGVMKSLGRSMAGDSFFINTWTGPGRVAFASGPPGDIIALKCHSGGPGWMLTKAAFIAGTSNIMPSAKWGGMKTLLGREGGFLTHVQSTEGEGLFFAGAYGAIHEHQIAAGESFVVDSGLFFGTPTDTQFKISKVGGFKSFMLGGEGLVFRFFGPCMVFTQSRDLAFLVQYIGRRHSH